MLSNDVRKLEDENIKLKRALAALETKFATEQNKPRACEYCKFYIQHYMKVGDCYYETNCGHCTQGRPKGRKPNDTCKYYELGTRETKYV